MNYKSMALLTDLYQLTMAYGYWKSGKADQEAVFHLSFRSNPFHGGYVVGAGSQLIAEYVRDFRFEPDDIAYLRTILGNNSEPIFEAAFLEYLAQLSLSVEIDAIVEGTIVFPHEPLLRVRGSLLQCQLLESALLNIMNFQSLVATKASRMVTAARGDEVLEFGLRRAQAIDGALAASRAAYIGGCAATSNVLAGKLYGIPVRGTHAHSWVMAFDSEAEAFSTYASAMPNNCVFLVDTYDTLEGVQRAIAVGQSLRSAGHKLVGIRLDSGDLAWLSVQARKLLDDAGFHDAMIVASNDLDERLIVSLQNQGAAIRVWGVGTKLVTAFDQPALGGVYKLGAIRSVDGNWEPKIKLSEQPIKTSIPGMLQVRRFFDSQGALICDAIVNELMPMSEPIELVAQQGILNRRFLPAEVSYEELLKPIIRNGEIVCEMKSLSAIRQNVIEQLSRFYDRYLRFDNPEPFPVALERNLSELKLELITTMTQ